MKKVIYALLLPLVVVSGLVFANRANEDETSKKAASGSLAAVEAKTAKHKWEETPGGIAYTKWNASLDGKNVLASAAKIMKHIRSFSDVEAVVTDLSLPPGSRLGFGVMGRMNGDDCIIQFDPPKDQLELLSSLKENDKIIIKSRSISHAPKYSYPIVSGDYVERHGKVIFKRVPRKGGC